MSGPQLPVFKPQPASYTSHRQRMIQESFDYALIASTELSWRQAAQASHDRIVANHYSPKLPAGVHKRTSNKNMFKFK